MMIMLDAIFTVLATAVRSALLPSVKAVAILLLAVGFVAFASFSLRWSLCAHLFPK